MSAPLIEPGTIIPPNHPDLPSHFAVDYARVVRLGNCGHPTCGAGPDCATITVHAVGRGTCTINRTVQSLDRNWPRLAVS